MLYIIGLGLNVDGISKYGLAVAQKCKKVYLENYTVDLPYGVGELGGVIGKKLVPANREFIEGLSIIDEAQKTDIALLVYGSPLTATTHITLLQEAKASGVKCKVIYNASILDAVAETGLQLYKFGKVTSMPAWQEDKGFTPDSFMDIVKENQKIKAHSLILVDPGMKLGDSLNQLGIAAKNKKIKLDKIVVCSVLGTKDSKIFYKTVGELKSFKDMWKPYCFIMPGELHFVEEEVLTGFQ